MDALKCLLEVHKVDGQWLLVLHAFFYYVLEDEDLFAAQTSTTESGLFLPQALVKIIPQLCRTSCPKLKGG